MADCRYCGGTSPDPAIDAHPECVGEKLSCIERGACVNCNAALDHSTMRLSDTDIRCDECAGDSPCVGYVEVAP